MFRGLACVTLAGIASAALTQPSSTGEAQAIEQQLHNLRSLPDHVRAATTRKLAIQIRSLPSSKQAGLAIQLSNLSTEGDFGRDTLQEVANTLSGSIRGSRAPDDAYAELARLVHYEHVHTPLDDPRLTAALAKLSEDDRVRQESDFTLTDLHGKEWTLQQLKGSVVLVNFWATWCPPCRKEMPDLEKLHEQLGKRGLVILAISDEEASKVKPFVQARKYKYTILLDPGRIVNERFRIQGIPKTLVYDRNGKLVAQSSDMRTMGQFREMLGEAGLQ